ncbi:MAG: thioredoxin [Gemmatimonadaceae bacterium]
MAHAIIVTDETFDAEITQHDGLAVVDFWAEWCAPCRFVGPAIEQLALEYHGRAKIAKLNVDESPETAGRFNVRSIPTLLFFRDGAVVDSVVGARPKAALATRLEAHLTASGPADGAGHPPAAPPRGNSADAA